MNVIVSVKGKPTSGRSTLIRAIINMLVPKGFDITNIDEHTISVVGDSATLIPADKDQETDQETAGKEHDLSALANAHKIVHCDREVTYGDPGKNLRTIAAYWNVHLKAAKSINVNLTEDDVCGMMRLLKEARLAANPLHRDSLVDVAGYVELQDLVNLQKQKS